LCGKRLLAEKISEGIRGREGAATLTPLLLNPPPTPGGK